MLRMLLGFLFLALCLAPRTLSGQQASFSRLARQVGAVRTAALLSASASPSGPRLPASPVSLPVLPPLETPSRISHRRLFGLALGKRVQLRAATDWLSSGLSGSVGLGVRF